MQLNDRVVLLTGASRGLGRALAADLCARGARVACVARDEEALAEATRHASSRGGVARACPFDLNDLDGCAALVDEVERELGPVSVLLCNAGTTTAGEIRDVPLHDFEADLRVNFLSAVALTRAVLPSMQARGTGTLGYVVSGAALRPLPAWGSYSASKAALGAFAGSLRVELAGSPMRVLTVFPGAMQTDFLARMKRAGDRPRILEPPRPVAPERVSASVVRAIERDRERVFVKGAAWLVRHLDHVAPSLVDRLLARAWRRAGG